MKNEQYKNMPKIGPETFADYCWLVFLYKRDLVNNIIYHLHNHKDKKINIPERYSVVWHDCVEYYNRHYGEKNGK